MTDQNIIFKNNKTGKVEQINGADMDLVNYQRFVGSFGLRIFMKNGTLHRYIGIKSGDEEKIASFVKKNYQMDMLEKELSLKGWNWGTANFTGSVLSFDCDKKTSFEIPLNHVSQCTTGKNEVTLEFHQNDDAPVSLMEMRMHIPTSESVDTDPVEAFHQNVMKQASVISVSGDAIAIFREIQCLTPRFVFFFFFINVLFGGVLQQTFNFSVVGTISKSFRHFFNCTEKRSITKYQCQRCCDCFCYRTRIVGKCFLYYRWIRQ